MIESSSPEPSIDPRTLAARLGGRKERSLSPALSKKVRRAAERLRRCAVPRIFFLNKRIDAVGGNAVRLQDGPVFRSFKLAQALDQCTEMVCFVATLGREFDIEIRRLMQETRVSEAYVMDALGSTAVESMVEQFYNQSKAECRVAGKGISLRFSPGYCDWPVNEQKKFFALFDPDVTGVELHESCLMNPRKSISGVVGIRPRADDSAQKAPYDPCRDCEKRCCTERRK